ncbi:MAG: MBL fold metallo-hydrolase [Aigarchaeota archaeon]|nr:MBL fold metallo-hydrolase [Aigarchaeota archaeon]
MSSVFNLGPTTALECLPVGLAYANCYLIWDRRRLEGILIDPGSFTQKEHERILALIKEEGLKIRCIVNTHGHPDHFSGNKVVKNATGAPIWIHREDAAKLADPLLSSSRLMGRDIVSPPADRLLEEGDTIEAGSVKLRVLHTPGHSRGGICLLGGGYVFTGDTLFAGSVGRTDRIDGSFNPDASWRDELNSIKDRLLKLPDETVVYPGHGPPTTIGRERRTNPFLTDRQFY